MKRGGHKSERHRSEVKNSRFNSHIKSTYCDELRNCQLHPVDPLIDPKSSSHGSVDIAFDEFPFLRFKLRTINFTECLLSWETLSIVSVLYSS